MNIIAQLKRKRRDLNKTRIKCLKPGTYERAILYRCYGRRYHATKGWRKDHAEK